MIGKVTLYVREQNVAMSSALPGSCPPNWLHAVWVVDEVVGKHGCQYVQCYKHVRKPRMTSPLSL